MWRLPTAPVPTTPRLASSALGDGAISIVAIAVDADDEGRVVQSAALAMLARSGDRLEHLAVEADAVAAVPSGIQ